MNNNLEIYNKYKAVPKEALKDFDNGRFKGTDINTMWRIRSLTEQFGPVGKGWYYKPVRLWTEKCENDDVFAFAEIELFVKYDNEWSVAISGTGGNKLQTTTRAGEIKTSDEAYKMAITDAFGVACKLLGIGADVYWANDKTKYTENEEPKKIKVNEAEKKKLIDKLLSLGVEEDKFLSYYKAKNWEEVTLEQLLDAIKRKGGKI